MKGYINTSNYYLSTITSKIEDDASSLVSGTFDVSDITVDGVSLPEKGYYWVDVDFGDVSKREIFRIEKRVGYTLYYDARISPYGVKSHAIGATVGLRDFSQVLNSLSINTDNFGQVEQIGDFKILVRGGNVFISGYEYSDVLDEEFTFEPNEETYIEYDTVTKKFTKTSIPSTTNYLIAEVICSSISINNINDKRSTLVYGGGEGDMKWYEWKQKYIGGNEEHLSKEGNVYDMDNMEQGTTNLYTTPTEKTYWNAKQQQLVSGQNIVTINGKSIIDVNQWEGGNIPLDTILTAGWYTYTTCPGISTFTFCNDYLPLTEDAFIVFSDSGTMLTRGGDAPSDYTYCDANHTITFNSSLADNEHAIIWTMYNNSDSVTGIGSGIIKLQRNGVDICNGTFNVNQSEPEVQCIDLGGLANDSTICFSQGGNCTQCITTNQSTDTEIKLQGNIAVTQEEYEELLPGAACDGNRYFIYEE